MWALVNLVMCSSLSSSRVRDTYSAVRYSMIGFLRMPNQFVVLLYGRWWRTAEVSSSAPLYATRDTLIRQYLTTDINIRLLSARDPRSVSFSSRSMKLRRQQPRRFRQICSLVLVSFIAISYIAIFERVEIFYVMQLELQESEIMRDLFWSDSTTQVQDCSLQVATSN